MSLASHFKKKKSRRNARTNMILFSENSGNKAERSLELATLERVNIEPSQIVTGKDDQEGKGNFGSGAQNSPIANYARKETAPFSFHFELQNDGSSKNKISKRRKRRKKKKGKGAQKENAESDTGRREKSEPEEIMKESKILTPNIKSDFAQIIRTPPGFSSKILKETLSQKLEKARETSDNHLPEDKMHKNVIDSIEASRKLQFRASDKGYAMVNHGSLAVRRDIHKERSKDQSEDQNAFSFGFTFDSLLKDYL